MIAVYGLGTTEIVIIVLFFLAAITVFALLKAFKGGNRDHKDGGGKGGVK
jgi:hypothetical protein